MTIKPYQIEVNTNFVARDFESAKLISIANAGEPAIIITHGRRRVGKTELLEQTFRDRNILKFEGIENQPQERQMTQVMIQLAEYMDEPLLTNAKFNTWTELLKAIANKTKTGTWTIYFEETQWLACYEDTFISELKFVWDNYFRHNKEIIIILCGSSPSFMVKHVIESKALYNRSQYEIPLGEFNLVETQQFLNNIPDIDVLNAYLTVGGIPEYLKWLKRDVSIFISLCQNSFSSGALFAKEFTKIFVSSLADNKHYKKIIEVLAKNKFLTRNDILTKLKLTSGGTLTELLEDLEVCGFIEKYSPFNLSDESKMSRYCISDNYLQYYFKFIKPNLKEIQNGDYNKNTTSALNIAAYRQWLGYAFERMCRKYHRVIAKILGFSGVKYHYGAYFSKKTNDDNPGYQIDLIFDRNDNVYTICEIKYSAAKIPLKVVHEFEKKLEKFNPTRKKAIQKVLITTVGAENSVANQPYFDYIITLSDLLNEHNWL